MQAAQSDQSLLLQCLNEAELQLQTALQRLEAGQPLTTPEDEADSSAAVAMDHDPDDLAAAFFAQQATQKKAASTLPINPWARTIYATRQLATSSVSNEALDCGTCNNDARDNTGAGHGNANDSIKSSSTKANELYKIFESALGA